MEPQRASSRGVVKASNSGLLKVGALSLAGVFAAVLQVGAASAVTDSEPNGGDQLVSLAAEVDVLAQCAWYLGGVDTSLNLVSDDGFGGTPPYIGAALPISAQDSSVQLYFSGSAIEDTACGIYVDGSAGIDLTVTLADFSFVGSPDTSMSFDLSVDNPLTVDMGVNFVDSGACSLDTWTDATAADPVSLGLSASTVFGIADLKVRSGDYSPSSGGAMSLPNCDLSMTYSTQIPAGLIPTESGEYLYTGPEMTVTIVNSPAGS